VGQEEAIKAVSRAIRRSRAGLHDPKRPIASFLFLGPTGVGKTELAKTLAGYLFESEAALVRIDMSEYMEKFAVSRLTGAPPGYVGYEEGGQITEKIRKKPYAVVLLDEIEKAHVDVFNILLQILDDGNLTDSYGRRVNFKNTIIIMTSNLGTRDIKRGGLGFGQENAKSAYEQMKTKVMEEAKRLFNPEFLNRIDEQIVFNSLTMDNMITIVDIMVGEVERRLSEKKVKLSVTRAAKEFIIQDGFDPSLGARNLRRAVQRLVEDMLAEEFLKGKIAADSGIEIDCKNNELVFIAKEKP
jgi:ATP-dependent Clp protease ATP-binding subunit ClpC